MKISLNNLLITLLGALLFFSQLHALSASCTNKYQLQARAIITGKTSNNQTQQIAFLSIGCNSNQVLPVPLKNEKIFIPGILSFQPIIPGDRDYDTGYPWVIDTPPRQV